MRSKIACFMVGFALFLALLFHQAWCQVRAEREAGIDKLKKISQENFILSSYQGGIPTTSGKTLSSPGIIIDSIWHDFQQDFSPAYMMAYDTLRKASHFTWMAFDDHPSEGGQRFTYYSYVDSNGWLDPVPVCICPTCRCGHPWIDLFPDGRAALFFHHTRNTEFYGALGIDQDPGMGQFRIYDLPDSLPGENGVWPDGLKHGMFPNGAIDNKGYIHITMTDEVGISPLAYIRCYEDTSSFNLICESPGIGTYIIPPDSLMPSSQAPAVFDSFGNWWAGEVVACSPVSDKAAIVYGGMLSGLSGTSKIDVLYIESTNNGQDWVDYGIPERTNLTNFTDEDTLRPCDDFSALYDYDDNLHIFFHTYYYDRASGYWDTHRIALWHWSSTTETPCGKFNLIAATNWKTDQRTPFGQMRYVSAGRGYLSESRNHLYCVWAQLDTGDVAANGYTNAEIYASVSTNSGLTWDTPVNLTNSRTPGCAPGECDSDNFPSIAKNVGDSLHIQYINDKDAGVTPFDLGSLFTFNPLMYLKHPIWTPPPIARMEWYPRNYVFPYVAISNHSYLDTTLVLKNSGYASLTGNVSSSASWIQISSGSFNISEGWCCSMDIRFDGTAYQETLLVDSIGMTSNDGFGNDTVWIPVQLVVSDEFYSPEFVIVDNSVDYGSIRTTESNVGNLGNKDDTAGIYLLADRRNLLYDGSIYLGMINAQDDTLVARWIFDKHYFLPETSLVVDTIPGLNTVVTTSRFFPFIPGSVLGYWDWCWWTLEAKDFMFHSRNSYQALEEFLVLKQIRLQHSPPPFWWPDFSPPAEVPETYLGLALDFDCPSELNNRNYSGYDSTLALIYLQGYIGTYESYLAGVASLEPSVGDTFWQGISQPYCGRVLDDSSFDGSWEPWWENSNFYHHISGPGYSIPDSDSIADYSCLMTGVRIPAHVLDGDTFEVAIAIAASSGGLGFLKAVVGAAKCGNVGRTGDISISDVVSLINYLFKGGDAFLYMSDVDGDCGVDVVDVVYLINYLFRGGPRPKCSCVN